MLLLDCECLFIYGGYKFTKYSKICEVSKIKKRIRYSIYRWKTNLYIVSLVNYVHKDMNLQKHLHCSHCYSIHFSETYTVQNNCKIVFSVILTFILIPCAHKKYIYNIYIQKKKKIHKSMSNNYCTKYSSPHNPLPTILACSLLNCPKLNQALAIFPFLSLFLWLSRISFLILTLLKSKLLTNLIKLIHGINSFNPPNISLHGAS